jgi:thymidylate kinase
MKKGLKIIIEGMANTGKTTLALLIEKTLKELGCEEVMVSEAIDEYDARTWAAKRANVMNAAAEILKDRNVVIETKQTPRE